jgi:thioredoxin 1
MKKWIALCLAVSLGTLTALAEGSDKQADNPDEAAKVVKLTDESFDKVVKGGGVVLVDFWAPWCGPCRVQGPILEEVAKAAGSDAVVGKVNVDEHGELAGKFGIQSIPTLIIFKEGKEVQRVMGVHQKDDLLSKISKAKQPSDS